MARYAIYRRDVCILFIDCNAYESSVWDSCILNISAIIILNVHDVVEPECPWHAILLALLVHRYDP